MPVRILTGLIICITAIGYLLIATPVLAENGPTFRILQPTGDQVLESQFTIAVAFQSSDDTPIVRFDAYLGNLFIVGGRITNPIPAGSFQAPADLSKVKVAPGAHKLYVKLTDRAGRVTQHEQAVMVGTPRTDRVPPTVRITAPKEGAGITGSATVRIDARDDSGIKWVMLYINGQLRMMINDAPYNISWDPFKDKLAAGSYTLQARAFDAFDNEGVSDPVVVKVLRPIGRTPIETTIPTSKQTTPGIFEVSDLYLPTGGPTIPRLAFSNVIAPITDLLMSLARPGSVLPMAQRRYPMPPVEGGPLALLPPKSLPGQAAAFNLEGRSLPTAPVLAWASYGLPHPRPDGHRATAPSLVLPPAPSSDRREVDADRLTFSAVLPEKGLPAISEGSLYVVPGMMAAEPLHPAPTASSGQEPSPAAPAAFAGQEASPRLVALVPGSMMRYTPSRLAVEVTAQPAANRTLPEKSAPALTSGTAAVAEVTTAAPITPSYGTTLSRPAEGVIAPRSADIAAPPAPAAASAAAQPDVHSPSASAVLPSKASPVLTASAKIPASQKFTPNPGARASRPGLDAGRLPAQAAIMEIHGPYTIRTDDTLEKIARAFSTTPDELIKLNPNLSPERPLPVNATLVVPKMEARIYLDETPLTGAVEPFIRNDYSMVPIRTIVEAKDGIVIWLPKTREVNAWAANTYMSVKIGDRQARINTEQYLLPVAPSLHHDRTMVPLRYLMSALNLEVEYNVASGTYYLVSR